MHDKPVGVSHPLLTTGPSTIRGSPPGAAVSLCRGPFALPEVLAACVGATCSNQPGSASRALNTDRCATVPAASATRLDPTRPTASQRTHIAEHCEYQ